MLGEGCLVLSRQFGLVENNEYANKQISASTNKQTNSNKKQLMKKIAVIGQGYVGLPLAIEFSQYFPVLGFDINKERVQELNSGKDSTLEADLKKLNQGIHTATETNFAKGYKASFNQEELAQAQIYIVTVPTPIDRFNAPDLRPLLKASEMLGKVLKKGDIVIYESTVYPGCTEEDCVPVLEKHS